MVDIIEKKGKGLDLRKSIPWIILSIIIAIGILSLFIGGDFYELRSTILKANLWLVLLAIGLYFIEVGFWTGRWKVALKAVDHDINFFSLYWIGHGGKFATHITPMIKASGDPFRAYLAKKTHQLPYDVGFGTLVAESAVSVPVILSFLGAGLVLWLYFTSTIWISIVTGILMGLAVVSFLPFVRWLIRRETAMDHLTRLINWLRERLGRSYDDDSVADSLKKFYGSTHFVVEHKKSTIYMVALSVMLYLTTILRFYIIFLSLGLHVPLYIPLLGSTVPFILGLIPFSPGGLIFVETGMMGLFVGLGIPGTTAASAVIIERSISYFISTLAGGLAASYLGLKVWRF